MEDNKEKLDKVIDNAKSLLTLFESMKEKAEVNFNCKFLKYLDRKSIGQYIIPYLELKDIICFRSTCKDMNTSVSSIVSLVSYSKAIDFKSKKALQPKMELKSFHELNDSEDVKMQLETLKMTRDFLQTKLRESEKVIKLYKNDMEYLKAELKGQEDSTRNLNEALENCREEQERERKNDIKMKKQLEDTNRRFNENVLQNNKTIDDLKKEIEQLKLEKATLTTNVLQFKKASEEFRKKNMSKAEALKSIRNFFLTSTLLKLKNYPEFNNTTSSASQGSDK